MQFHVRLEGEGDLVTQIYRSIRTGILEGRLAAGEQLPPSRELAGSLQVSRSTVTSAYERLTAEGFLTGKVGSGTRIADIAASAWSAGGDHWRIPPDKPPVLRPRRDWAYAPEPVSGQRPDPPYDFRAGIPDATLFPYDTWRRLVAAELRLSANRPGRYACPAGHEGLRAAIARLIGFTRSVRADPDDVLVTNGTQHAMDIIARVMLKPGDVVAIEDPGYPPPRALLRMHGATVVPVPVDSEGIVVDQLPTTARLVYTTPSHQFPLGMVMSLRRRTALLRWADRHGAGIIEDDYDSEFRFADRPLDALHSLDTTGRVLYIGTFSKVLLPSLRIGYVVAPASLREPLRAARQLSDGYGAVTIQAALARFIDDGRLAAHVRKASRAYAARRDAILHALAHELAAWLTPLPAAAGLHLSAWLHDAEPAAAERVLTAAAGHGLAFETMTSYSAADPPPTGLVLGYGALHPDRVTDGLAILADVLRRELPA